MAAPPSPVRAEPPAYVPPPSAASYERASNVTSVGIPRVNYEPAAIEAPGADSDAKSGTAHAALLIERGDTPGAEFPLVNDDSTIGRWDADNGIFPDVDLDAHDADAKVSRRHARIIRSNGSYVIEDLGSTNGTYVNRGRRLLPGNPHNLANGDEVIVGKTFLRFKISR